VYGDAGMTLPWADLKGKSAARGDRRFVACHEVVDYLGDFVPRGRRVGDNPWLCEALRDELARLERGLPEEWRKNGQIQTAIGEAYSELGLYAEAIEHYEAAVQRSDAPLKVIEQLANLESRVKNFRSSVARLRGLCRSTPSSERYCLVGATLKRWAKATDDPGERTRLIKRARAHYAKACALNPPDLYYPLSNKVALDLSLNPESVSRADLKAILRSAEASDDEWSRAARADAGLLAFLAFGEGTAEDAAAAYERAFTGGAGATRRERDSMLDHVAALAELAVDPTVKERAESVRKLLPAPAGGTRSQ
jgi:tetratricopeptide (TPR) repeat protein